MTKWVWVNESTVAQQAAEIARLRAKLDDARGWVQPLMECVGEVEGWESIVIQDLQLKQLKDVLRWAAEWMADNAPTPARDTK